ncbi:hypothetical protein SAMN04487963_0146 [Marinobacter zhejiangensis]|uniref:Uncharacterized protein n=2 Tax=Marinobacter zhejiangensis TaxID=488535 RepID=A0A1I4KXM6_9GAMM|nr:hypothetical protein SAMN04487963_0146 [Marinobacter zhejiangensis]
MCRHLLGVKAPWDVSHVRMDAQSRQIHVYLTRGRSWFGRYLPDQTLSRWRHTNLGSCQTFIHATVPDSLEVEEKRAAYLGESGNEFSHGLASRVVDCLQAGMSYRQVCDLMNIDVHLAWQIRLAISEGTLPGVAEDVSKRLRSEGPGAAKATQIPPGNDPVWHNMLSSDRPLEVRMLSLRLLLTRCRQEFGQLRGEEARRLKINEIRRFFIKHEKQLASEIEQLAQFRDGAAAGRLES